MYDYWGMAGSISSGIMALAGDIAQADAARDAAQQYNEEQRSLAEYQNEWNLQQWNRENEYNSPLQQMKRFQEAGLNPNLIYGQQNLSASSPNAVGYDSKPVQSKFSSRMAALGNILNIKLLQSQIKKTQAEEQNINANTGKSLEETRLLGYRSEWQNIQNGLYGTPEFDNSFRRLNEYNADYAGARSHLEGGKVNAWLSQPTEQGLPTMFEIQRNDALWNAKTAGEQYEILSKYGMTEMEARIYNLIHGTYAQQMAARASMLGAQTAFDRLDFDKTKYNDVKNYIIQKAGNDALIPVLNLALHLQSLDLKEAQLELNESNSNWQHGFGLFDRAIEVFKLIAKFF